jgi:hypothetical protein
VGERSARGSEEDLWSRYKDEIWSISKQEQGDSRVIETGKKFSPEGARGEARPEGRDCKKTESYGESKPDLF